MVAKSVIEIDIQDEKFKAFQAAFEKYQKILDEQSKKWEQVNKNFDALNKKQKDFNKSVQDGLKGLKEVASLSGTVARNMASAAFSAAKFIAFGAIGGGFGLGGLAASASDYRKQAQGLGISTGQLRAANLAYGRVFNPESALTNIADIRNDLTRQQILTRLGGGQNQSPADQLSTVFRNAVQQFKAGGQTKQFAEATGLTQIFSLEDLRRGANMTAKELAELDKQFAKYSNDLAVADADSKAWQDFWYQLRKAGNTIETSLIKNLTNLTPELIKLSDAVGKAIDDFLSSKEFKNAIQDFISYISSPDGKQAISDFFEGIKAIAQLIGSVVGAIPDVKRGLTIAGNNLFGGGNDTKTALQYFMDQGFNKTQATGLVANLYAESGLNPKAVGDKGQAVGIGQWHPDRQAIFEKQFGKKLKDASFQEQLEFIVYELTHSEQKALSKFQSAKTVEDAVKAGLAYERPANYEKELKHRTDIANNIQVKVFNNTGNNAVATAAALPGGVN